MMEKVNIKKDLDQTSISSRIDIKDEGVIEYTKAGHGTITTDRPITAVRLELALDDSGLTQAQLAKLSTVRQPTISRIVDGKIKQSKHITKIANALGVTSSWLTGINENEPHIKVTDNTLRISSEEFILIRIYEETHNSNTEGYINVARDSKMMIAASSVDPKIKYNDLRFIIEDDRANVPDIKLGASVTFNTAEKAVKNGDFYVIKHGDLKACVRKLYREPNGDIRIRANQDDFPEYIAKHNDENFQILGRVLFVTNVY